MLYLVSGAGTRQEKQLASLLNKQKQFKDAALQAKQSGDLQLAKEYLRQFKCFDPLIEATKNGIPVDWNSVRWRIILLYMFLLNRLVSDSILYL